MKTIEINSLEELPIAAREIIDSLDGRTILLLNGGMGAGKTTLTSAIVRHLGSEDGVSSPTFAIINHYESPSYGAIYHFDMYRIESPREALEIGIEEYFDSGALCIIEWGERIEPLLPNDACVVEIAVVDGDRRVIHIN